MNQGLEKEWRARYDRWANVYGAEHLVSGWSERGLARRRSLFMNALTAVRIDQQARFLDLGAGPGVYSRVIKSLGYPCVALDYSHKVLELAKQKDRVGSYVQGEAYHLPLKSGTFHAVVCIGVLQSLADAHAALAEMQRVLAPGGVLFLDGLSKTFFVHKYRFVRERLRGEPHRMSHYDPFQLSRELGGLGFEVSKIHWLVMPELLQNYNRVLGIGGLRFLSWCFGYAFMISARKVC